MAKWFDMEFVISEEIIYRYLDVQTVSSRSGFEEKIGAPADGGVDIFQFPGGFELRMVKQSGPRQSCYCESHWKPILDIVSSVIIPSNKINLYMQQLAIYMSHIKIYAEQYFVSFLHFLDFHR